MGASLKNNRTTTARNMTEGPILRQILFFALPLMFGNLFQMLYNTVDSVIVGNFVSKQALAAVGSTTVSAAAAATAASMALPPFRSTSMPAAEACGVDAFTIPPSAKRGYLADGYFRYAASNIIFHLLLCCQSCSSGSVHGCRTESAVRLRTRLPDRKHRPGQNHTGNGHCFFAFASASS